MDINNPDHPLDVKLQSILHAGNRARELVSQILAFSRMREQILSPVRIDPIIKEALKLLKASMPANIELETAISSEDRVLADPTQIHQIIMNLCTNAYHAMEKDGGILRVSLKAVPHTELETITEAELVPGKYLQLIIEDTGTGIKPAVLDRIFDPYFSTKHKDKGTGLGLSVVHGIINNHGGSISVRSELGKGTVFYVILPVTGEASESEGEKRTTLPRGTEKILFIDDEKDIVDIGCQMLDKLGYDVTGVAGSIEALEMFKQDPQKFDLIITDLSMPSMTGDRLAGEFIDIRPGLPVLLCTGFSDSFDAPKAPSLGIRKLLMKPLAMNILAEAVREILDKPESSSK